MALPARVSTARSLILSLQVGGWSEHDAGNLVALANGLWPSRSGWSVREIEHLRWLRGQVRSGRLTS
jgi:hypothetical protein